MVSAPLVSSARASVFQVPGYRSQVTSQNEGAGGYQRGLTEPKKRVFLICGLSMGPKVC